MEKSPATTGNPSCTGICASMILWVFVLCIRTTVIGSTGSTRPRKIAKIPTPDEILPQLPS